MPVNNELSGEVWNRYAFLRDNGHTEFVVKQDKCEEFFAGRQWSEQDLSLLRAYRRPALTINKILSTISNVLGEQIQLRTDVSYRPTGGTATEEVAEALTKVFMEIRDANKLDWVRSDVFCDGVIGGRGFFDARLDFSDSLRGEVSITTVNPKNVLIDADADEYDPDQWGDVVVTKWMTIDEIEKLYGKANADLLRGRRQSYMPYGLDVIDSHRDRFGTSDAPFFTDSESPHVARNIRVLERQWRKIDKVRHFVDLDTGHMEQVPEDWSDQRVEQHLDGNPELGLTKKMISRVR